MKKLKKGLKEACHFNVIEMVDKMIESGANVWNEALIEASMSGNIEIAKKLIAKGAQVTYPVIEKACRSGNFDLVLYLVENGNGVNTSGIDLSCLYYGLEYPLMEYLIENGVDSISETLFYSVEINRMSTIELLIKSGADLNFKLEDDSTLNNAFNFGYLPTILILIYYGVSIDSVSIQKIPDDYLIDLYRDWRNGKLWNTKRNIFFPKIFQQKVFNFFLSVKIFSQNNLIKIPKPLLCVLIQMMLDDDIENHKILKINKK